MPWSQVSVVNMYWNIFLYCKVCHFTNLLFAIHCQFNIATVNYRHTKHQYCGKAVTHWGRVTHICVSKLTSIGSDNGLSPNRRQAFIWTNAGLLLIGPLRTNFSEILIGNQTFSLKKMHLKLSSAKWRLFRLGLKELMPLHPIRPHRLNHFFGFFVTTVPADVPAPKGARPLGNTLMTISYLCNKQIPQDSWHFALV